MKLKIGMPKWAKRKTSEFVSKEVSAELGGDCHIRITECEIGMKDKKVYARFAVDGEMDRKDFMNLIKMAMQSEGV